LALLQADVDEPNRMAAPSTTSISVSPAVAGRRPRPWRAPAALILALAALSLLAGLALARPELRLGAADPQGATAFVEFGAPESSEIATYRWSLPGSTIALGGLERRPVLLTLRMFAPRPPEAPPAATFLTDDSWRLGEFVVTGDPRRYQLLLPPASRPIKLRAAPFVPGESDRRQLGVALTHLSAAPTALTSELDHAWATLGAARAATLLLLPLAAFVAGRALVPTASRSSVAGRRSFALGPSVLLGLAALPLPGIAAANPLAAAALLPHSWVLPAAIAGALALGAAMGVARAPGRGAVPAPTRSRTTPARGISAALRRLVAGEGARAALLMSAALVQGVLFLFLMPPWQHYDEPSHFEYALLIAGRGALPEYGASDTLMRREMTAAMIERGFYDPEIPVPPILSDSGDLYLSGGGTATGHQPPYYLLASLPLWLGRYLDITSQLYLARAVSLLFYLVAVAAAIGVARDLAPPGSALRWLLPLAVILCASYADLMTAVNNDGAAAAMFALFLWGAARLIRHGPSWRRLAWMFGAALVAALVKNTGAAALALAPVALVIAVWAWRGWRWRWLALGTVGVAAVGLIAAIGWDDAASWYRWAWPSQPSATRVARSEAPLGAFALRLEARPGATSQQLSNPLLPPDLAFVRGRRVTVGAWLWAERPATVRQGVLVNTGARDTLVGEAVEIGTTPRFVSWSYEVPRNAVRLQYAVAVEPPPEAPLAVFVDGAVVTRSRFPTDQVPTFDDASGQAGVWGERRFENHLRNASAEESGPRFRPWLDQSVARYARRAPSAALVSALDVERTWRFTFLDIAPSMVDLLFTRFGWGWSPLPGAGWQLVFRGFAFAALLGCALWLARARPPAGPRLRPALVFLGIAALAVWGNGVMRIHPLIDTAEVFTSARYGFPAIIPTMLALVGGWLALWPDRLRGYARALLIAGMLLLEIVVVARIWAYYYG
jgi:hypothetical protein